MSTIPREAELSWLGTELSWLPESEARSVFARAEQGMSPTDYALDTEQFQTVETISASDTALARAWLAERIGRTERVFVSFGSRHVCAISASAFLTHWQDMFGPARDDVLITDEQESWILFYHHEDQFQFGRTKCA